MAEGPSPHLALHLLKLGGWPAALAAIAGTVIGATQGPPIWVKNPLCTFAAACTKTLDGSAVSAHIGLAASGLLGGALVGFILAQFAIAFGLPKEMLGAEGMFD